MHAELGNLHVIPTFDTTTRMQNEKITWNTLSAFILLRKRVDVIILTNYWRKCLRQSRPNQTVTYCCALCHHCFTFEKLTILKCWQNYKSLNFKCLSAHIAFNFILVMVNHFNDFNTVWFSWK